MKTVLVQYTTRDDATLENEALIHAVFDELRENTPLGLDYTAFKHADSSTFVHLATIDTPDGTNPLLGISSFKRFQQGLPQRCVSLPQGADVVAVDSYQPSPVTDRIG